MWDIFFSNASKTEWLSDLFHGNMYINEGDRII